MVLSALSAAVDVLLSTDPTGLDEITLGEEIVDLHVQLRRLEAARADRLRVFETRDAAVADGFGSAAKWLAAKVPTTTVREAKGLVHLGRDLAVLPAMAQALADGAIGTAHVRQVARATRPLDRALVAEGDAVLAPLARTLDAAQFACLIAVWLRSVRPDDADKGDERDFDSRGFSLAQTFGGMWHLAGNGDPEGGALLHAALEARAQKTGPDDPRKTEQRWYDALISLAQESIAHAGDASGGGNVPEIIVRAHPGNLTGDPSAAPATLEDGATLSRCAFDRLACDARWTRLLIDAVTQTIDLGRTTREWSPALRKVIHGRDGGCRYPGCKVPARATQIHHCVYWRNGGETCADNGLLLCRWHHHCVHARGYTVKLLPEGTAEWTLPSGKTLESRPRGPTAALLL